MKNLSKQIFKALKNNRLYNFRFNVSFSLQNSALRINPTQFFNNSYSPWFSIQFRSLLMDLVTACDRLL